MSHVGNLLDQHTTDLLESIIVDEVFLATLVANKVLQHYQCLNIQSLTKTGKVQKILDYVRSNPRTYLGLCKSLKETRQDAAYSLLSPLLESQTETPANDENKQEDGTENPPSIDDKDENISKGLSLLKEHYKNDYRDVPSFFSHQKSMNMEENYFQTNLTEVPRGANTLDNGIEINEDDIFEKNRRQILIDGKAGSGKTTLTKKYAWQWTGKSGSNILNNLLIVILCTGSSIDQHGGIKESIKKFLSQFDPSNSLFHYYESNSENCLVIFEAMDEAGDAAQDQVNKFLESNPKQPVMITARTDEFSDHSRRTKHFRKNPFTKEQALEYLGNTFPAVVKEVEDMLAAETIDAKLLETPYNCQSLGELLIQEKVNANSGYGDGIKLTTTMLFTRQIAQLKNSQSTIHENFFQNLAKLALWSTFEDKQSFKKVDLERFQVEDCGVLLSFMTKRSIRGEHIYGFQHELKKNYLAALAVMQFEAESRNNFYRVLCSTKKYGNIVRYICGLLGKEGIDLKQDFNSIVAHKTLLGEIEHHQSAERNTIVAMSKRAMLSTLQQLCYDLSSDPYSPTEEETASLAKYRTEVDHFNSGPLPKEEASSFLDGDNGISCFSWPTLHLLMNIHLCLHELPIAEKQDLDVMKRLIGTGRMKDGDSEGKKYVFPVPKTDRWGQMLIKEETEQQELWILAHNTEDAKHGLNLVPKSLDPSVLGIAIPSSYARSAWGIPKRGHMPKLSAVCRRFMKRGIKRLLVWLETPLQLKDALPNGLDKAAITLFPYGINSIETWTAFLDYLFDQRIDTVGVTYSNMSMVKDGFLEALCSHRQGECKVNAFRALDGTIRIEDALTFSLRLCFSKVFFQFDQTLISDIEALSDAVYLMDSGMLLAVSLRHSDDLDLDEEDCNKAIAAQWSATEPTDDTTTFYKRVLENTTMLLNDIYELPICRDTGNVQNMESLLDDVLDYFKWLPKTGDQVTLVVQIKMSEVKDLVNTKARLNGVSVKWSKSEGGHIRNALLTFLNGDG